MPWRTASELSRLRPKRPEHLVCLDAQDAIFFFPDVIATEMNKNYMPAQIFHALKGSGSIEGSENLEAAGGGSLKR